MCEAEALCRLCLSDNNLTALFKNSGQTEVYTSNLFITTGLKIEANDGLPQRICKACNDAVNSALDLRKRSYLSEQQLLNRGYQKSDDNIISNVELDPQTKDHYDKNIDFSKDFDNNEDYPDTIDESNTSVASDYEIKSSTERVVKKLSKKDQRQMYLSLVEGELDPKGPVTCKICKMTVSKWACFLSHAKLHLGFNFVCEFCGKSFISTTKLNRHCRSHHGMRKELKCQYCSYLALDNAQLKLHERRMHTGERPYVCDVCASSYHSRRCLVQHLESHRTVANVQCDSCPQAFKSQRALSRHRYSAHAHTRVACPHCTRVYSRKYLTVHIGRHHADIFNESNLIHTPETSAHQVQQ